MASWTGNVATVDPPGHCAIVLPQRPKILSLPDTAAGWVDVGVTGDVSSFLQPPQPPWRNKNIKNIKRLKQTKPLK